MQSNNLIFAIKPQNFNITGLKYCPPKFVQTKNSLEYVDGFGKTLSSAIFMDEPQNLVILDLSSNVQNKGYGTKLLDKIKELYKDKTIELTACWEEIVSPNPPHKFYLKNGFVPSDETIFTKLKNWISNGAKPKDFPQECDVCNMFFKP